MHMRRPPFDPSCKFVHLKPGYVSGQPYAIGDPVERSFYTPRRLRQMYDGRMIAYAAGQTPAKPANRPLAVGPTDNVHPGEAHPPVKVIPRRGVARRAAA